MAEGIPKKQLGNFAQAGDYVASTGSVGTITFDKPFNTAPIVVVHAAGGIAAQPTVSVSGCTVDTTAASASGSYIAWGN